MQKQLKHYKDLNGYYPEVIITDRIYLTRENPKWLKERNIRFSGKPLGRPSQEILHPYQKRKKNGERNQVEGKFGQGKNAYNINRARTRTARTSESWIACIMCMMNLIKFDKVFLFSFIKWLEEKYYCSYVGEKVFLIPV